LAGYSFSQYAEKTFTCCRISGNVCKAVRLY